MKAFVNDGRWVAFCGTDGCDGAEQFFPDGQLHRKPVMDMLSGTESLVAFGIAGGVLHCGTCRQSTLVEFPEERQRIEEVLLRRPLPVMRNWYPGESVTDLIEENELHGVD